MFKKITLAFAICFPLFAGAINITVPQSNNWGDVLRGNINGQYSPVATSTLGIKSDDVIEGAVNKFYTQSRVWTDVWASSTLATILNNSKTSYGWGDHAVAGYIKNLLGGLNAILGNATTTNFAVTSLADPAGALLAVNQDGTLIATSTPSGGGTVTSVNMSVPTGLTIAGNPITSAGTLALSLTGGYVIPKTASTTEWATAYGWGDHAGAGYLTNLTGGLNAILGNSTTTSATTTNLAVTGAFNFLGSVITNVSTWFNGLFDTQLATKSTTDLAEGTNLYYTNERVASVISSTTTDALREGSNNLYYTQARVWDDTWASTTLATILNNSATAFGWGNHAEAGYLTNLLGGLNAILGNSTTTNATTTNLYVSGSLNGNTATFTGDITSQGNYYGQIGDSSNRSNIYADTLRTNWIEVSNNVIDNSLKIGSSTNALSADLVFSNTGGDGTLSLGTDNVFDLDKSLIITGDATTTGILYANGGNSGLWNTAYGWGDHASAGYLTNLTGGLNGVFGNSTTTNSTTTNAYFSGKIDLPETTAQNVGVIYKNNYSFIHDYHPAGQDGFNLFIGENSGNFTMSDGGTASKASYNLGIGRGTLSNNTSGYSNTMIGYATGISNTTGYENVGLGRQALAQNQTGNNNTSIGFQTLYNNTGSYNTALGYKAGDDITSGGYNLFLGYNSGNNASQKADAENSIAIGNGTFTENSNEVVLGNSSIISTILRGVVTIPSALITNSTTTNATTTNLYVSGNTTLGTLSGILKATSGSLSVASAGTDYVAPATLNNYLTLADWFATTTAPHLDNWWSGLLAGTTTDALDEGDNNKYYTQARTWTDVWASTTLATILNNSVTAFGWGDHSVAGYLKNLTGGLNAILGNSTTTNATTTTLYSSATSTLNIINLVENARINLGDLLTASGKFKGIVTENGRAGETLAFGDIVYLKSDGEWWKADADATTTAGQVKLGVAVDTGTADATTTIMLQGKLRLSSFNFPTIGAPVYVSTDVGLATTTAPSGTGDVVRVIGHVNTSQEFYFNPDSIWITLK